MLSLSPSAEAVQAFIDRWRQSGGHERAAVQLFLTELCDLLDLPHADPPSKHNHENSYCFERAVPEAKQDGTKTTRFIDCYKRGCFALETKQGINPDETQSEKEQLRFKLDEQHHVSTSSGHGKRGSQSWDTAMEKAKGQAEKFCRLLPPEEGRRPSLSSDVGHVFELYAEFSLTGGSYLCFPHPKTHRIYLEDLADPSTRTPITGARPSAPPKATSPSKPPPKRAQPRRSSFGQRARASRSLCSSNSCPPSGRTSPRSPPNSAAKPLPANPRSRTCSTLFPNSASSS